jgi:hypothetical protein
VTDDGLELLRVLRVLAVRVVTVCVGPSMYYDEGGWSITTGWSSPDSDPCGNYLLGQPSWFGVTCFRGAVT